jgi:hypothetical protein
MYLGSIYAIREWEGLGKPAAAETGHIDYEYGPKLAISKCFFYSFHFH